MRVPYTGRALAAGLRPLRRQVENIFNMAVNFWLIYALYGDIMQEFMLSLAMIKLTFLRFYARISHDQGFSWELDLASRLYIYFSVFFWMNLFPNSTFMTAVSLNYIMQFTGPCHWPIHWCELTPTRRLASIWILPLYTISCFLVRYFIDIFCTVFVDMAWAHGFPYNLYATDIFWTLTGKPEIIFTLP